MTLFQNIGVTITKKWPTKYHAWWILPSEVLSVAVSCETLNLTSYFLRPKAYRHLHLPNIEVWDFHPLWHALSLLQPFLE